MTKDKKVPAVDYETCVACGVCIMACPVSCLELTHISPDDPYRKARPELRDMAEFCTGCGMCAKSCPIDAIAMDNSKVAV